MNMNHARVIDLEIISLSLVAIMLLFIGAAWIYIRNRNKNAKNNFLWQVTKSISIPALILIGLEISELFLYPFFSQLIFAQIHTILRLIICLWIFACISNITYSFIYQLSVSKNYNTWLVILPHIRKSLKTFLYVILLNVLFSYISFTPATSLFLTKLVHIVLIISVAWFIYELVSAGETLILRKYELQLTESADARRDYTKARIFKRIVLSIICFITFAALLMVFRQGRELGASILASAGLITAIVGFAAQQPLSVLLAGFQIAMTQPIKIGDNVIVENEFGTIEEISLNYVVVRIWDLRKLIVPINYFIQKPFQNWTYNSANLIAPVLLYFDYSVPIDALREELAKILEQSQFWDKKVSALQVSDAKENIVEIRVLGSAVSAGDTWNLRCEIREKMIKFVRENYPNALPRSKFIVMNQSEVE